MLETPAASSRNTVAAIFDRPEIPSLAFLTLLSTAFALTTGGFASGGNLMGILQQAAPIAIVALALNQVIIAGEIDISMGSMVAALAFVFAGIAQTTGNPWLALAATVICGAIFGSLNGLLNAYVGIPSIVATLGTLMVLRGGLLISAGDLTLYAQPAARFFGSGNVFGVPTEVVMFAVVLMTFAVLSSQTSFGRQVYAVGGNGRAARDVGIPVERVKWLAFTLVGVCAALTSAVFVGQVAAMQANAAAGFELKVIAAVVLGGTSLSGGRGSNLSPVIGALLLSVILNATALNRVPPTFESLILGIIILAAVTFVGIRARIAAKD
jgi:ribose/xylose/arabinose/galactoside ABC-type transport system permease subunit